MISGHATVKVAVEAIRLGAYEFIEKPFTKEKIINYVNRAIESSLLKREKDMIPLPKQSPIITYHIVRIIGIALIFYNIFIHNSLPFIVAEI